MADNADPNTTSPTDAGDAETVCGDGSPFNGKLGLRVGAIFIILVTSLVGTLFPIVLARLRGSRRPPLAPEFGIFTIAKYFGSGVIIATAFIHLLAPANEELGGECLESTGWGIYPYAEAFAMASMFALFVVELFAFRLGERALQKWGLAGPSSGTGHSHAVGHGHADDHGVYGQRTTPTVEEGGSKTKESDDGDFKAEVREVDNVLSGSQAPAQMVGVAILEFGVIFHSLIIGLTLAVDEDFVTLFIVLIFHQMFEGLGLGSRLAYLQFPAHLAWIPYVAGTLYAIITPLGIAIGLGVRETYNPESQTASIVSGVLDAISAGILLYTGLVELLAHDFIFNPHMAKAPLSRVTFAIAMVLLGAGLMALLGRWA